jgi:hypothetical protein
MHGLSKSRYTLYCQCEKALWLKAYKPQEEVVDSERNARFENGNKVGDLAMGLFGPYVEVTTLNPDGSLNLDAMVAKTKEEMQKGTPVICEASFFFENNYCAVDILRWTNDGWAIYEVKSSNGKEEKRETYACDIAYQQWLLTMCGIKVTGAYLVCLNSNYVRQGAIDLQQLFTVIDMEELVKNNLVKVPQLVSKALQLIQDPTEPNVDLSQNCKKPYECAFLDYCKRLHSIPTNKPNVFDLYRIQFSKALELYQSGCITFPELDTTELSDKQQMQVVCTLNRTEHIDYNGVRGFLDTLRYPLYFLDFETMNDPVPQYDGTRPYQQIPFQYSLHIKESETAPYVHKEFLAPSDGSDPRQALAEQLCHDIPMNVCTLAYNKQFECGRIKELADSFPDLADHLINIRDNIKDLLDPFQKGYYYVPAMGGSFSIKSVLPALFPNDPELDYHKLDQQVQNGNDAMSIFPKIKDMNPSDAQSAREALLRYCELDTWAMVKVLEKLKKSFSATKCI